jgi:ribose-phosphate pyrophosphokinase
MILVGNVSDKIAILVDDMVDTAGTLCKAAQTVKDHGSREVLAICTHGSRFCFRSRRQHNRLTTSLLVLSGNAISNLNQSCLDRVVVTNTVPLGDKVDRCPKLRVIDVSPTIAESIRRTHNGESVR